MTGEIVGYCARLWGIARGWIQTHVTLFRLLYWTVAVATFRHSAIGFATLEAGSVVLGALAATAVDVGMMLAAERLRDAHGLDAWLVGGLSLAAVASVYSQLLYAVTNASAVAIAPGAIWMQSAATWIVNLRVIILPVLLPTLAVVYSFASRTDLTAAVAMPPQSGAVEIAEATTKTERARLILAAAPTADNETVAALVGCSSSTVRLARNGGNGAS
jgi:hypothetical protein